MNNNWIVDWGKVAALAAFALVMTLFYWVWTSFLSLFDRGHLAIAGWVLILFFIGLAIWDRTRRRSGQRSERGDSVARRLED